MNETLDQIVKAINDYNGNCLPGLEITIEDIVNHLKSKNK